jgi:hypothetical protein
LVETRGPRTTLLAAFAFNLLGSLAIAVAPGYLVVIGGLFIIGSAWRCCRSSSIR